jgi:hypothetical protein
LRANVSDQPFSGQSQLNILKNRCPLRTKLWWRQAFSSLFSSVLQKVGRSKTAVDYAYEDKTLSITETNCVTEAVKDEQMTEQK